MKYTPDKITSLGLNQIFVFGSNVSGKHGAGAAKTALQWGAKWGQGNGLMGRTYGIPTKLTPWTTLKLSQIEPYISEFIEYAKAHPNFEFMVTLIGCGYAGYKPKDIAPMFKEAISVDTIVLPKEFIELNK